MEREERMKGAKERERGREGEGGMMTAERREKQTRQTDRKERRKEAAEPKPTNERANNRGTTERPKRGKTMKSELQIRKFPGEREREQGRKERATSCERRREGTSNLAATMPPPPSPGEKSLLAQESVVLLLPTVCE